MFLFFSLLAPLTSFASCRFGMQKITNNVEDAACTAVTLFILLAGMTFQSGVASEGSTAQTLLTGIVAFVVVVAALGLGRCAHVVFWGAGWGPLCVWECSQSTHPMCMLHALDESVSTYGLPEYALGGTVVGAGRSRVLLIDG
jgi:hypothetical protein